MKPDWIDIPCRVPDAAMRTVAERRQQQLTKPPGSLGRLETLAVTLAGLQRTEKPAADKVWIALFAGDHGIAAEGVSAFPQEVTAAMLRNFAQGGAAICVLAETLGTRLEVINLGTAHDPGVLPQVHDEILGPGTANSTQQAAMTDEQYRRALSAGRHSVERALEAGMQVYIGGEMGIANSASAAAIACALLDGTPEDFAGPGTGLNAEGVCHKATIIRRALDLHAAYCRNDAGEALRRLGGFEIAALTGAYLACAQHGMPAVIDGFICSVAALCAVRLNPGCAPWFIYAHHSAEPAHRRILTALQAEPLLDLGMRLGEASGAATAVPLLRLACALHNRMASFEQAAIPEKLHDAYND